MTTPYTVWVKEVQDRRRARLAKDATRIMSDEAGRRFVYWLVFERGELEAATFPHAVKDGAAAALHQAWADGRRALAGDIRDHVMQHCPDEWVVMLRERIHEQQMDAEERKIASRDHKHEQEENHE